MKDITEYLAAVRQLLKAGEQAKALELMKDLTLRTLSESKTLDEIAKACELLHQVGREAAQEQAMREQAAGERQPGIPMSFVMPFLSNALFMVEGQVPEGDAGAFVERHTRESQIELLTETLSLSLEFATELYENGVRVRPEKLGAVQNRNLPASPEDAAVMDAWYCRGVDQPPSRLTKNLQASTGRGLPPLFDKERARLKAFCEHLGKTSPEKDRLLDSYIPVWHASTVQQIYDIVAEIKRSDAYDIENYALWFRGQDQDHRLTRSRAVRAWLNYPEEADSEPSLLASLARLSGPKVQSPAQSLEWESTMLPWAKAFIIWGLLRHSIWLGEGSQSHLRQILADDGLLEMEALLATIKWDSTYEEADGFRSEFFTHHKYNSLRLVLQHYGMPTSCLDITRNVEVALFFALHKFDSRAGRFVPVADRSGCFLSLFADSRWHAGSEATSARSSEDLFRRSVAYPLPVPLRVVRQECGLLYGADAYGRNRYADLMIGKIRLDGFDSAYRGKSQSELFPCAEEDDLYDVLLRCRPVVPHLVTYNYLTFSHRFDWEMH